MHRRSIWIITALLLLGALFRIGVVHWLPNDSADDGLGYAQIARNLLELHVYSHATEAPFDPSYVRLPGYPLFLATIYSVFGHTNNSAVRIAQALIDAGTCALVAWLAFLWQPDERRKIATAIAALALAVVNPFTTIYAATILTEVPATFLIAAACIAATIAFQSNIFERELRCWAISGLLLGVGVLFRPDVGLMAASIGITLVVARLRSVRVPASEGLPKGGTPEKSRRPALSLRPKLSRIILAGAVFSFAFALALAPWTIRNWRTFHVFQPLAPPNANMPDEFATVGYERWLKTWMTDGEFLDDLMWGLDKNQIDIDDLPDSAFDSPAERERVSDLFDQYNAGDDDSTEDNEEPDAASSPSPSPDQSANKGQAAKANNDDNSDDQDDAQDNKSNGDQGNKTNNDQPEKAGTMTPEIDAAFAQIARERIARHPLRYYLVLPARRAHALWFNTHSDFYPFGGNALPLNNPDNSRAQNFWLPIFAILVAIYTLLGVAGFVWMGVSGPSYARAVVLMIFLIFATRLALFSMAVSVEPRYVVEFFPFLSAFGAIAIVEGWMRLRRNRHVSVSQ
ncbi:MAG TPA: glycosyltransferase family 39 protein [Pyrinomonadaceae bacterium]|nr:glycosyltransferase family 39 protein [Pyrinomonadaceae bacterium]